MGVYLRDEIDLVISDIKEQLRRELDTDVVLFGEKDTLAVKTRLQGILKKRDDSLRSTILEIILTNALEAEKLSPGGFEGTLRRFVADTPENQKLLLPKRPCSVDLEKIVDRICGSDTTLSSLILEAVQLGGFGGRVSIEKSPTDSCFIEVSSSYSFDVKHTEMSTIVLEKPSVVCIDGYVESVAEINRLFEGAVKLGRSLVLLCRGYHNDVISTVKLNNKRGIFSVFPLTVPFDVENINTMVDLGSVCGVVPVSSTLGQLITNVSISDSVQVDEVKITANKVHIKNHKSETTVAQHVNSLLEKRSTAHEGTVYLYDERIRSLSSRTVTIKLPKDYRSTQQTQVLDQCLRSIRSAITYGVVDESELYGTLLSSDRFYKKIVVMLDSIGSFIS